MRRICLLVVAALCLVTADACVKKCPRNANQLPLTIIVMDTTQALLNGAEVKIGKRTYTTSFDGRIVLKPEQVTGNSLSVSCEGYESMKQAMDGSPLAIVALTPKPRKEPKGGKEIYYTLGVAKGGVRSDKAIMAMATADFAEEAEVAVPMSNNVSAGKLTAGEVNDFAKWQLWERYLQSTESFQKTWGIVPRQRYTIQVTNKNGYPIANYPVQIKDDKGNTLFQAITDNTGKAELWGKEGFETLIVDEPCEAPDEVDVMFVFDATGSMGDELRYLQAEMKDVIARAKEATGGLTIRTGAVVYRDHLYDEYLTRISRLTEDISTTQAFIDKQSANGGGDYPEAVPEALMAALNSAGWSENARARIAFLILDAPCHEDSATLALLHDQILNAAAMGVRIVPVVCSGIGESGEYLMRAIALSTNGTTFFLTDDSGIGLPHLKPNTDSLKVEHLNDMLVRTIVEFSAMTDCRGHWTQEMTEMESKFVPNPFEAKDLTEDERQAKDSRTTLYLLDISGKLIYVYQGNLEDAGDSQLSGLPLPMLSTGVYFVKAFYDGEWHTKKILVH